MLYEMVTGTRPFERPSEVQTLSAIIEAEPAPIGTLTPKTPAQLQQVIHRCLSKEPSGRYASTTDLARDLAFARQHLTATTAALTPAASAAPPRRGARASAMVALVLAGVLAGVLGVGWFVSQSAASRTANAGTAVPFGERDWLLICEFQNQTGEEIFDKSLSTALAVSLGQSSYVNIVPSTRIQAVLRQMRRSPLAPLDVDTAREIAQREGIRLVMAPTIAGVGGVYMLSAALLDPSSGAAGATATARASDRREVIAALDELGRQARRTLGEAASAIAKQAAPLMTATTSSLEALKLLSQGVEMSRAQQFKEARTLYENALRVDPSFTAAKVALGMLEWEFFDPPNGKQLLAEAAQQTDHLTLVEKYTTVALDAQVRNDLTKAVDTWKAFLALYPDRASAHNNLGRVYHQLWRLDEAATEFREAIRLEPTLMLSYFSLNSIYLHDFGDFDAVIALCKQQIAQTDQNPWAYVYLGWASLGKGDLEPARVAFERTLELFKNLTWAAEGLGHTYRRLARYPEALQAFQRMLAANPGLTVATYHAGIVTRLMGDEPGARKLFAAYRADAEKRARQNEPGALFDLAVAHARLGDMAQARAIGERAAKLPRDEYSSARSWFLAFPTLARPAPTGVGPDSYFDLARLHAVAGKTAEAIDALATALQNGYRHHAWIRATPDFDSILADPRLQALLAKTFAR
jgi:tetratricopeptide (TPR) repeat protein